MAKNLGKLFGAKPGGVKVIVEPDAVAMFLAENKEVRDLMFTLANDVKAQAVATASDAEKGPGGTLDGYAAAGFSVEYETRGGKRPRINIKSNADGMLATKVHFYTQKRDGVGHLRAALYRFTSRG